MNFEEIRALLPLYASDEPDLEERTTRAHRREIEIERLKKRYGIALLVVFAWAASLMLGCCITGVIVQIEIGRASCRERV